MSTSSTSKTFTAAFVMPVSNVGRLLAEKKVIESCIFTCPDDPQPVSFVMRLAFGGELALKKNRLGVFFSPISRTVYIESAKFVVFDKTTDCLNSKCDPTGGEIPRGGQRGFPGLCSLDGIGNVDWQIRCEIVYNGVPETGTTESTKCDCECKCTKCTDKPTHLLTWSKNMLDLFTNPREADVVFLVGQRDKEKINAHKSILSARSTYFRSLFEPSANWKENQCNEIELDEDPPVFKEVLKFLYCGLPPENFDQIAIELLPVADKYILDELKELCDLAIRRILSPENVVNVLQIANKHNCFDLFVYCLPLFKANIKTLKEPVVSSLKGDPNLLFKLLQICAE